LGVIETPALRQENKRAGAICKHRCCRFAEERGFYSSRAVNVGPVAAFGQMGDRFSVEHEAFTTSLPAHEI
jgi:hypothetical protein